VWVLFLNADGTVKGHQKISDTAGSFTGTLDDLDFFGWSVSSLGDLDGDGMGDLAVGAVGDDGEDFRGAVWVLFLDGPVVTRYVSTTGSDAGNDCTDEQNSCATLSHAVSEANPSDVIELAAGTYIEMGVLIEKAVTIQGQGVVVE